MPESASRSEQVATEVAVLDERQLIEKLLAGKR